MIDGFILSPYRVSVDGFGYGIYHARSRGMALSAAYHSSAFNGWTFREFLIATRCWKEPESAPANYGRIVEVGGEQCHYVSHDRQYMQFVRPGSDVILNTHPLDVKADWIGGYPLVLTERKATP